MTTVAEEQRGVDLRIDFTRLESGQWMAESHEAGSYGAGDTVELALHDLLVSMVELRDLLGAQRYQLGADVEDQLIFLESLAHLDAMAKDSRLHAAH